MTFQSWKTKSIKIRQRCNDYTEYLHTGNQKNVFIKQRSYAALSRKWQLQGQDVWTNGWQDWRSALMEGYFCALTLIPSLIKAISRRTHLLCLFVCASTCKPPALQLNPNPLHMLINLLPNWKTSQHLKYQKKKCYVWVRRINLRNLV